MGRGRVLLGAVAVSTAMAAPAVATTGAGAATVSKPACTTAPSSAANVNTDCDPTGSNFETAIAVNPTNPRNIVGAAIRIGVTIVNGQPRFAALSRPRVSFDGGRTWATYDIDYTGYTGAVDPTVAFDARGTVYLGTTGSDDTSDIAVTHSDDGGRTWSSPVKVTSSALGPGAGVFNDHPQLTAWGNGNVLVTWIREVFDSQQALVTAPVYDSVSHDGGVTWTTPTEISGSAPFCKGRGGGNRCDQTFGNAVAVSRAWAVVTFQETDDEAPDAGAALGRDKYLSVIVDPISGRRLRGPTLIGQSFDGINEHDYPLNGDGQQTLHDSQFGLDSDGNVAADPTDVRGLHFAVVWYDDRKAPHPVDADPYQAVTDADVVVSQTRDGGRTWSPPTTIRLANDQFMPWAAYDASGRLRVGFFDRSYDGANQRYGYTLASEVTPGSLRFSFTQVSTALSDPTRNNLAGRRTVNPAFPFPAPNIGDYTAIATTPTGVVALWTDLREQACNNGRCGARQDAYFASVP